MPLHARGVPTCGLVALAACLLVGGALAQDHGLGAEQTARAGGIVLGLATAVVRTLLYLALLGAVGGTGFLHVVLRDDPLLARRLQPGLLLLCAVAGVAAVLDVGLHGVHAAGGPVGLLDRTAWAAGVASARGLGGSMLLIGLGLLVLAISAHGLRGSRMAMAAGTVVAAAAVATGSDASLEHPQWLSFAAVMAHVTAAAMLVGSVWPIAVTLTTQSQDRCAHVVRRFSATGLLAGAGAAVSGLLLSPVGLLNPAMALGTFYGLAWLLKLSLVSALAAVVVRRRLLLTPALLVGGPGSRLDQRRSILRDGALYAAIVLATVLLELTQTTFFPPE